MVNLTTDGSSGIQATSQSDLRTLAEWQAVLSRVGGTINSLQLGVGSGNAQQQSYVEWLAYTNSDTSNGATASTTWYFYAAPLPSGRSISTTSSPPRETR